MLYHVYEWQRAALEPARALADATRMTFSNPLNPFSRNAIGRSIAASAELFERMTRRYEKPAFGLSETEIDGKTVAVSEEIVWRHPFCNLLHFRRDLPKGRSEGARYLLVAPMSGHYATLLRGTVEAMLPHGDVFITDWVDARDVPLSQGAFDLDSYIDYVVEMLQHLGPNTHVIAVCQPSVPVYAAVAKMNADNDPAAPATMILMGGPMDTRLSPTAVNDLAAQKGIAWFRDNVIMTVPWPHPGVGRKVYPGFMQLSGFMSMNLDRHVIAHKDYFLHLVQNDGDSAEKHRDFYDEYLAVMDMTAEFYLQTVESVFIRHDLPLGKFKYRDWTVDANAITQTAILTIEGEKDDITGHGQTRAVLDWCKALPDSMKVHYTQPNVGHYGVFNGSRFRANIVPRIVEFANTHASKGQAKAA
ncbi:polyhydroxyalkanoate depolymerase [Notoacmeibacter ruber]|uniref:Polyhydroxyalkanoate depolymerase n=1 Tax=Notoacmeibacter ruber TaxID=2670375 RepID=A0A3L7JGG2_9HYPH|nr:polyhydroxyalkanoate depolymerase [Notoacmeibacter ruber]RLQ89289.1 polyhydroxyalkanoate depolymerase [Notoacmeibacter ruber]